MLGLRWFGGSKAGCVAGSVVHWALLQCLHSDSSLRQRQNCAGSDSSYKSYISTACPCEGLVAYAGQCTS